MTTPRSRFSLRRVADIFHNEVTAWIVLGVSLMITVFAWYIANEYAQQRAHDRFLFEVEDARERITKRMLDYEQVLRGGVSLMRIADEPVTREQWRRYVANLRIQTYFPGIQGIGFALMLAPEELSEHIDKVRAEGFPQYTVKPEGQRDQYSSIVYLEPFDWRNQRAFGYDMFSQQTRREAMIRARDSGHPAVSGRVILVQETEEDVQAGFLVYVPFYDPRMPTDTVEQRRAALIGFVYSPFRANDLMRGILGTSSPDVGFGLYDGVDALTADTLLYQTTHNGADLSEVAFKLDSRIELPGRNWTASFYSTPSFDRAMASYQPVIIAIGGLIVDLLLFTIIWSLATERRRVELRAREMTRELRASTQRLELAQQSAKLGTWEYSLSDNRLHWDRRMFELYDMPKEETQCNYETWRSRVHPDDLPEAEARLQAAIQHDEAFNTKFRVVGRNGVTKVIEAHGMVQRDEDGRALKVIGTNVDVTALKEQQQRLEMLAHYDPLTELPNRILFADRMELAIARAGRSNTLLAVCYMDLDGFKPINDRFGHAAGDQLLTLVASRLMEHVRGSDSVARFGGDEFVLIFGDLSSVEEGEQALDRLLGKVSKPYYIEHHGKLHQVRISASIGVSFYPLDDVDADTLLRHADQAMYLAKQSGRNTYYLFDPENDRLSRVRRQAEQQLHEAIREGQLVLYYQPKVDMRRGDVVGLEALVRWQHPERGLLPPGDFLALADEGEMSGQLGHWVIDQAMQQIGDWQQQGLSLKVSVNISGAHLQQHGFINQLRHILKRYPDVDPRLLELEILETTALEDVERVSRVIEQCRALGLSVAIDDFGTGYSSLTYLKRLPADVLKIDKSFVIDMLTDTEDLAIVEGIVGLSQAFRRQVIAEGVESVEHGVMLLRLGCDVAQGYGIAKPMEAGSIRQWLEGYQQPGPWREMSKHFWLREDLPLLSAELDHRIWVDEVTGAVEQEQQELTPPALDETMCRFGHWYFGIGRARYAEVEAFESINDVHHKVHMLAGEMLRDCHQGQRGEARGKIERLNGLRDDLIQKLHELQLAVVNRDGVDD